MPCFLAPLFVWKAYRSRRAADVWQAAALLGAALVQLDAALSDLTKQNGVMGGLLTRRPRGGTSGLVGGSWLPFFSCVLWMKMIVLPLFGLEPAAAVAAPCKSMVQGGFPVAGSLFGAGSLVLAGLLLWWLADGVPRRLRWLLAGSYASIAGLTILLSFGDKNDAAPQRDQLVAVRLRARRDALSCCSTTCGT